MVRRATAICPGSEFRIPTGEVLGERSTPRTDCAKPIWGPKTDDELLKQTLEVLNRRNIIGVASGPPARVAQWKAAGGDRIIPGLTVYERTLAAMTPEDLRKAFVEKRYLVFGEVAIQYDGMSPSDPAFDPYLAVAEEMDVPMAIHIGTGPPGAPYLPGMERYRARLHSALLLEDALIKHPKLRVYICMPAGR